MSAKTAGPAPTCPTDVPGSDAEVEEDAESADTVEMERDAAERQPDASVDAAAPPGSPKHSTKWRPHQEVPDFDATEHLLKDTTLGALVKRPESQCLPLQLRRDILSAIKLVTSAIGLPIDMAPADPVKLRDHLDGMTAAMAGVQHRRWINARSLLCRFLGIFDARFLPSRIKEAPNPAWQAILALIGPGDQMRHELTRFARYCSRYGLTPDKVNDEVIATYLRDLTHHSLVAEPARSSRDTSRYWNQWAERLPSWPQQRLAVADNVIRRSLPWAAYPPSLLQDAEAWISWRLNTDPTLDDADDNGGLDCEPIRQTTAVSDRKQIRLFLGELVRDGVDPASLVDLRAAFTLRHLKAVLRVLRDRGQQRSHHASRMVAMTKVMARDYLKLEPAEVQSIGKLARFTQPANNGMTEKNKTRLRVFEDTETLNRLIRLPLQIRDEVVRAGEPTLKLAQQLQSAVALEILLMNPLRLKNLGELRIGRSLIAQRDGSFVISLQPEEVKNSMAIESRLTDSTAELIRLYLEQYRPFLGVPGGDWLFPGQKPGCPKSLVGLRDQIQKAAARRGGVRMNPHLFRHLMAFITLSARPQDYASVARGLGHKSLATVFSYYTGPEIAQVFRHIAENVRKCREDDGLGATCRKGLLRSRAREVSL